jgi:hypothetical protein
MFFVPPPGKKIENFSENFFALGSGGNAFFILLALHHRIAGGFSGIFLL